jgi:hypothetical protein
VTGSNPFSIEKTDYFEFSFRKLAKSTAKGLKRDLVDKVDEIIQSLLEEARPSFSRQEPCPKKVNLPPLCEFRKIELTISKGASGQIRLMYLADFSARIIKPIWIYSHEQFSKRPPDSDLTDVIRQILED